MPSAIISFSDNRSDVDDLIKIHRSIGGSGPGRRWNLGVLHKAAIVLTCSIWEAFVEDLIIEAVGHIAQHLTPPDKLPKHLKQQIAKRIKADVNQLSPWDLAGSGWQDVIRRNAFNLVGTATGPPEHAEIAAAKRAIRQLTGHHRHHGVVEAAQTYTGSSHPKARRVHYA